MASDYNGGLTREQFLYFEIRIVASLMMQGHTKDEILKKIRQDNLFQFPTERMISSITGCCFRRIDALNSQTLTGYLANASAEVAKQVNLYAMMKYNRIVWDFMITVVGEKYRTQEFDFSRKDLNVFFFRLQERFGCLMERRYDQQDQAGSHKISGGMCISRFCQSDAA